MPRRLAWATAALGCAAAATAAAGGARLTALTPARVELLALSVAFPTLLSAWAALLAAFAGLLLCLFGGVPSSQRFAYAAKLRRQLCANLLLLAVGAGGDGWAGVGYTLTLVAEQMLLFFLQNKRAELRAEKGRLCLAGALALCLGALNALFLGGWPVAARRRGEVCL